MASLHTVTSEIKTGGKWTGIVIGFFVLVLVFLKLGGAIKEMISPTPPPPPTVSFGKLPAPSFSASFNSDKYSYTLNTVSGLLPSFPDRTKVYKISNEEPNLLAAKRAREQVSHIELTGDGYALSPTVYQWNEAVPPFRKIVVEILNFNFNLTSSYALIDDIKNGVSLPSEPEATSLSQGFFNSLSAFPKDIDSDKTKTTLFSLQGSDLIPANSISTTQIIRVDFYQKDLDNMKIFYPNPPYSSINTLVAGGKNGGQVVEAHLFHNTITDESGTYPIITANEAWEKLKKGEAFIANYKDNNKNINIREVALGYYSSNEKQDYLTPIVVFMGDNDFYAYVPAIKSDWYLEETNKK